MTAGRFSRQDFLGKDSDQQIARCTIGIPGLGGGGSHIVQQLAHIGFKRYVLYDDDVTEESNLNRLIGAESRDARAQTPKLHIAKMMILGLQPDAIIRGYACKWQEKPEPLRECQIVLGAIDGYRGRRELEIACRRYLMHYIDIGMDVHGEDRPVIGGQVILSSPGGPCMTCLGFLTEEKLGVEAARYGNAGARPQVVWPNGVLASTAVGFAVELVTGWTRTPRPYAYMVYNGNDATLATSKTLKGLERRVCPHFPLEGLGDPVVTAL
jgi:molybdopterin-synthase adenylyltransferase